MSETCGATVLTLHGTIWCDLPSGHEGRHNGACERCAEEDGVGAGDLAWDVDGEDWTA